MVERKGYTIDNFYQGGYSTFKPLGTRDYFGAGKLGETTDPRNANILQEVASKLSSGVKNIEIELVSPEVFDSIPKQQLKEVNRLAKLTGIDISVHGPVVDTAGFTQQGFSETDREIAQRRILQSIERVHEINPKGNIPVNFHSAEGIPGSQFLPPDKRKDSQYEKMIAVNRETGRLIPLQREEVFYPGGKEIRKETLDPERRLNSINKTEWDNSLFQIEVNREHAERIMKDVHPILIAQYTALSQGKIDPKTLSHKEIVEINQVRSADEFVRQAKLSADSLFSKAYENAKNENNQKKIKLLKEYSQQYGEKIGLDGEKIISPDKFFNPKIHTQVLQELLMVLEQTTPKTYVPIEKFTVEQSSKTFGNAAFDAYKKFKDNTPTVVIENPPAGFALSTGEDLKNLVVESRKRFVTNAIKPKKEGGLEMSEGDATKTAEKLIGATWDVGHINMLRKYGYKEKDIIKEAETIAPFVKHVHLSDNFGFEHTELPMGMGNVPIKEVMAKLGEKGFEAKKIIEAGQWWQNFKTSPFQATLEGMGVPVYTGRVAPYWNQTPGFQQDYFGGYGMMLPQTNYEIFGAGFSQLPSELGGQKPGATGSRMSGRPME